MNLPEVLYAQHDSKSCSLYRCWHYCATALFHITHCYGDIVATVFIRQDDGTIWSREMTFPHIASTISVRVHRISPTLSRHYLLAERVLLVIRRISVMENVLSLTFIGPIEHFLAVSRAHSIRVLAEATKRFWSSTFRWSTTA